MGYRFEDKPPKPEDHLRRFAVRNGGTMNLAFACYYLRGHNPKHHDFMGWPNPVKIDQICQELSNMRLYGIKQKTAELEKIHLIEEGYTTASIAFEDDETAQNLDVTQWIDEDDDNIVKVSVSANFPTFSDKPVDLRFTLFVSSNSETDAVCHGVFTILPGPPAPTQ